MPSHLDALRSELHAALTEQEFAIFHGLSRLMDNVPMVHWDARRHPDFHEFLRVARQLGTRLMIVHEREFIPEHIEGALQDLQESNLFGEPRRELESRLHSMRRYEGELCLIEMSFDYQGRIYLFTAQTDWYEDLNDVLDEIETLGTEPTEGPDHGLGGFFSRN